MPFLLLLVIHDIFDFEFQPWEALLIMFIYTTNSFWDPILSLTIVGPYRRAFLEMAKISKAAESEIGKNTHKSSKMAWSTKGGARDAGKGQATGK